MTEPRPGYPHGLTDDRGRPIGPDGSLITTPRGLPAITDLQRLTVRPGDRLVIRTDEQLTQQQAARLREIVRHWLGDLDVPAIVLIPGMEVVVIGPGEQPDDV